MEDKYNFCVKCGRELPDDAEFCPECGAVIGGNHEHRDFSHQMSASISDGNGTMMTVLIFVYVLFAFYMAYEFFFIGLNPEWVIENTAQMYESFPELEAAVLSLNPEVLTYMGFALGGLYAASGVMAAITGILWSTKSRFKVAYYSCLAASVLSFATVITVVVGIVISMKIKEKQYLFNN